MRQSHLLVLLAASSLGTAPLYGASFAESRERIYPGQQQVQEVTLADIIATPQAFQNTRIRFRAMFIENSNLFDRQHTYFTPYTHCNLLAWDERAQIWDPQVRANPVMTIYIAKDRVDASRVGTLRKYQYFDATGEVTLVTSGVPSISLHSLTPIEDVGTFTDTAVYHAQQGVELSGENSRAIADDHFAAALASNLPASGAVAIGHLRGQNLLAAGEFAKCVEVMNGVIAQAEQDLRTDRRALAAMHFLVAKAQVELEGANDSAVAHARTAVELDPEQGDAYAVLGITLAGAGKFDEARRQCEKAIRLRPNNAEVRWYLGRILDQQGAYEEAIDALRKAIDLTPKDGRLHKAIASAYFHRGQKATATTSVDFSAALQEYNIAVRLNPADAEAHVGAGQVLDQAVARKISELTVGGSGKVQPSQAASLERYKAAVAADGTYLPARRMLAGYYRAAGKTDEAIAQYRGIADADPTRIEAWSELGAFLLSLGQKDEAYATYQRCLQKNPTSSAAKLLVAGGSIDAGKAAEGLPIALQVTDAESSNGQAWLVLARLQLANGQPKDARKSSEKATELLKDPASKAMAAQVHADAEAALK